MRRLFSCLLVMLFAAGRATAVDMVHASLPPGKVLIDEDRLGRVYITVLGTNGSVLRADSGKLTVWRDGKIAGMAVDSFGDVWVAKDQRVLRYGDNGNGLPIDRTESFRPQAAPGPFFASRLGDVWAAGCRDYRQAGGLYAPATHLPGMAIQAAAEDSFGNLWGIAVDARGRRSDLAVRTFAAPNQWQPMKLPAEQVGGEWSGPVVDDVGFVWTATANSVYRNDPRSPAFAGRRIPSPVESAIASIARVADRQLAVGFANGAVRELSVEGDGEATWNSLGMFGTGPVRAAYHDRQGHLWVVSGDRIYRTGQLQVPWHRDWDEQPRMPAGNHDHIFARLGDKLYTAGGKTYFGWPASEWVNLDHVWSYDVTTGMWQVEAPMLEPGKAYSGIAAMNGELWLLGGYFRDGNGTKSTPTVEIFNPRTRRFRLGPSLDLPRGQIVALPYNERLYAIGGGGDDESTNGMLSIGAGESSWRREPSAPAAIVQASGCVVDDKFFVAAGSASKCAGLFVYDTANGKWTHIKHPTTPSNAPLCTAFGGEVWVMGGWTPDGPRNATHIYSPRTTAWRKGPDIPMPVSWAAAAEVNGRLLIAGGAYRSPLVGNYFNTDRVFLLRER